MKDKWCGVYDILNKVSGTIYIGSSNHMIKRLYDHRYDLNRGKHKNDHLQKAWKKYGEEAFEFRILTRTSNEMKLSTEQAYLDFARNNGYKLYNIGEKAHAPLTGRKHTEETKRKISEKRRLWRPTEEHKAKTAASMRGFKHSEESKAKIAAAHRGKKKSPEQVRNMSLANLGKRMSEQAKAIRKQKIAIRAFMESGQNLEACYI